jgi:hypothetical protein
MKYVRRSELEEVDCHIVILDISSKPDLRIINLYRSFNPPNNMSARDFFNIQLQTVKRAITNNTVIIGDFNLDLTKKGIPSYAFASYFDDFDLTFNDINMAHLVDFLPGQELLVVSLENPQLTTSTRGTQQTAHRSAHLNPASGITLL